MDASADTDLTATPPLLEVRGLVKRFGSLVANDHVDLLVREGEIHALLGENGAGKSTLVKMLYGALQPDEGSIAWRGSRVRVDSPSRARSLGIGMVFQHFSLFEALDVAANIALSLDGTAGRHEIATRAASLSQGYGLALDPHALVGDLSVGERQRVEIVRCLLQDPALIVLDEPTSVLTPQEADALFVVLERLRGEGRSILYISHRLDEVRRICDRATVLRHGRVVGRCDPRRETAASLAAMMVGSDVAGVEHRPATAQGEPLLELRGASLAPAGPFSTPLRGLDLSVRAGEVVGIAGVAGNGQSELFDLISGEARGGTGALSIRGRDALRLDINERRRLGAAFVPEERLGHAAVPAMPLSENLLLSRHASDAVAFRRLGAIGLLRRGLTAAAASRICAAMDVRKGTTDPDASALSGGNLQKFVIGRELDRQPAVLVVNQPTWGVDAGAAARIRQALIDLSRRGAAVLVISQDLDELLEIADRLVVMHDGRLSAPLALADATRERLGLLMGGAEPGHAGRATSEVMA